MLLIFSSGSFSNQFDFTLISIPTMPEPSTNDMIFADLFSVGFMVCRKNKLHYKFNSNKFKPDEVIAKFISHF